MGTNSKTDVDVVSLGGVDSFCNYISNYKPTQLSRRRDQLTVQVTYMFLSSGKTKYGVANGGISRENNAENKLPLIALHMSDAGANILSY